MPLKISKGNMYDWVTHTHSHLGGECPHKCTYCYVKKNRFGVAPRYLGAVNIIQFELDVDYKQGRTIFIEHMNDMFAKGIEHNWIERIFAHCNKFNNQYVFQTKDTERAWEYHKYFPPKSLIGTTIETNREVTISSAPQPFYRHHGIKMFSLNGFKTFITIEPIMDFDVDVLLAWLVDIKPSFVNIGADSKQCNLSEPSKEKVQELIKQLQIQNITIKKKTNLSRIC